MKTLIVAYIVMTSGVQIEIVAPSLEQCEMVLAAVQQGETVQVTDEAGITEHIASIECRAELVNTPDDQSEVGA